MTTEPATLEAARAAAAAEQADYRRRYLKAAHEAAQDAFWAARTPAERADAAAALKAARDARRADEAGVTLEAWLGRRQAVAAAVRAELAAHRAALKESK